MVVGEKSIYSWTKWCIRRGGSLHAGRSRLRLTDYYVEKARFDSQGAVLGERPTGRSISHFLAAALIAGYLVGQGSRYKAAPTACSARSILLTLLLGVLAALRLCVTAPGSVEPCSKADILRRW